MQRAICSGKVCSFDPGLLFGCADGDLEVHHVARRNLLQRLDASDRSKVRQRCRVALLVDGRALRARAQVNGARCWVHQGLLLMGWQRRSQVDRWVYWTGIKVRI